MRRKDREVTDFSRIAEILDTAKILHLGINDDECPYIVPLHYGWELSDGKPVLWTHGAKEGHKLDLIRRDGRVCVQIDCGMQLISGGDVACKYGSLYASVIGRGTAAIAEDPSEKAYGLAVLMRHQTGRDFAITPEMASSVCVIKITLSELTAKERPAP